MMTAGDATPVAILAGAGALPFALADSLAARGRKPVIFAIRGHGDPVLAAACRHTLHWVPLGRFGRLFGLMRAAGCRDMAVLGGFKRFALGDLGFDLTTLRLLPRLVAGLRGGDDHAMRALAEGFGAHGFRVVGLRDLAPELLMPEGTLTARAPDADATADIALARAVLDALSPFDVGQGSVVIDRHVVALEDAGGTDALLTRVGELRRQGRLRTALGRGVLVKVPKTGQDLRLDLPGLGIRTVEGAAAAGLAGIAVAAGYTVVSELDAMVAQANRAGLFVVGFDADPAAPASKPAGAAGTS